MSHDLFHYKPSDLSSLPFYISSIKAGFPSPADDFIDVKLDLNEHLVKNPVATYFIRVVGDSMKNCGIFSGDLLIVDRSLEASNGSIVIVSLDGELIIRRVHKTQGKIHLLAENVNYAPIEVGKDDSLEIWGVVTYVLHRPL